LPVDAGLLVKTERGEFEVKLYTQEAPLTSLNLYTLAKKGFFKDVTFHRIVPDFVAQGGDPAETGRADPGTRFGARSTTSRTCAAWSGWRWAARTPAAVSSS